MKIDTEEVTAYAVGLLKTATDRAGNVSLLDVGIFLVAAGTILGLRVLYKDWKKKKGYRMAVRERTTKENELLTIIINDGLFEAELAGRLSEQRMNALYNELSKKLDLPDLVPKERRVKIVKDEILRRRIANGKLDPHTWRNTKFSETIGGFANKFWVKKA